MRVKKKKSKLKLCSRHSPTELKSVKHTQLSVTPSDCQLELPQHTREQSGTSTPIAASQIIRQSPQIIGDPPEGDDTDPDVIPNQYGK